LYNSSICHSPACLPAHSPESFDFTQDHELVEWLAEGAKAGPRNSEMFETEDDYRAIEGEMLMEFKDQINLECDQENRDGKE
jgi:hypothetical protein